MTWLLPAGVVVTLAGLAILTACVVRVVRAKRTQDDEKIRLALQSAVAWNLAAMGLSAIGLMMVVLGLVL